jgi:hypothetical protein
MQVPNAITSMGTKHRQKGSASAYAADAGHKKYHAALHAVEERFKVGSHAPAEARKPKRER